MIKSEFIAQAMLRLCAVQDVEMGEEGVCAYRFLQPDEALRRANRFWREYADAMRLDPDAQSNPAREAR